MVVILPVPVLCRWMDVVSGEAIAEAGGIEYARAALSRGIPAWGTAAPIGDNRSVAL